MTVMLAGEFALGFVQRDELFAILGGAHDDMRRTVLDRACRSRRYVAAGRARKRQQLVTSTMLLIER